jgi:hypothetical protein
MIVCHIFFYCVVSLSRNYRKQAALDDAFDIDNFSCRVLSLIVRMQMCISGIQCISYGILSVLCFFPFQFRRYSLM